MRAALKAVYDHFYTGWGGATPLTPIAYGNDSAALPDPSWVRISMTENDSNQHTIGGPGNKLFERKESVYVQIFVAADTGDGPMRDLIQAARDIFEGVSIAVSSEALTFFKVDSDPGDDEPHLKVWIVEAQCRYQQRK